MVAVGFTVNVVVEVGVGIPRQLQAEEIWVVGKLCTHDGRGFTLDVVGFALDVVGFAVDDLGGRATLARLFTGASVQVETVLAIISHVKDSATCQHTSSQL